MAKPKTRLYRWPSECFTDIYTGGIIVMAAGVRAARKIARAEFVNEYPDKNMWKDKYKVFEADIAETPEIIESNVYFEWN